MPDRLMGAPENAARPQNVTPELRGEGSVFDDGRGWSFIWSESWREADAWEGVYLICARWNWVPEGV